MSALSPEARRLLDQGRPAHDPPPAARARVRAAVDARVRNAPPPARPLARWLALAGGLALLALVAWLARRPPAPVAPPPAAPVLTAPVAAPVPVAAPTPAPVVAPTPAPVALPSPAVVAPARPRPQPAPDTLAEELRLLNAARRALAARQLDDAARPLAEHARRFPRGQLAEEREATAALVTCARGDRDASARAAERFLRAHPRSPQAPRVRRACGVE